MTDDPVRKLTLAAIDHAAQADDLLKPAQDVNTSPERVQETANREHVSAEERVRHVANARSMLSEGSERSFVADTLQGLLDRIAQLEREKAVLVKRLRESDEDLLKFGRSMEMAIKEYATANTEADTLAQYVHAEIKNQGTSPQLRGEAYRIAERRVKKP